VFDEYALSEGFKVSDTAIFCTSGPLEYDSAIFLRGTGIHRASPWFKVSLKLNAVAEARARYREWCADEWDLLNSGSPGSPSSARTARCANCRGRKTHLRQGNP
jgi:hypothetical protein